MKRIFFTIALLSFGLRAQEVEFLHWWTSNGEIAALGVVKKAIVDQGNSWKSTPVKGGGGDSAMAVLQARAIAGNPPTLAQLEGAAIKSWAKIGFLTSLNDIAIKNHWDDVMLPITREINKYNGNYVAIPINIHRINWLWVNNNLLDQAQVNPPKTWDEFIIALQTLKAKGIKPLALGNSPWQISMLFENIAIGVGGKEYYKKAFVELSPEALNSDITFDVLSKFRKIAGIIKDDLVKQYWDEATTDLINNKAAFQVTGDWVIGELISQYGVIPEHISCYASPQTEKLYIYNMDSFIIFDHQGINNKEDITKIVMTLSSPEFQKKFSKYKGSIPARSDIDITDFNRCSLKSRLDFDTSEKSNNLLPSMTDTMAVAPMIQNVIVNELYRFFNDSNKKPEQVISRLASISNTDFMRK